MQVFKILKILGQILGVFPFDEEKKIFYVSKFYIVLNVVLGFFLLVTIGPVTKYTQDGFEDGKSKQILAEHPLASVTYKFEKIIALVQMSASLTALVTKFIWRKRYVEILNTEFNVFGKHGRIFTPKSTRKSDDCCLVAVFCFVLVSEVGLSIVDSLLNDSILRVTIFQFKHLITCSMIVDEIIFCFVCSVLSSYNEMIKQMILIDVENKNDEEVTKNSSEISAGYLLSSQLKPVTVIEGSIKRFYAGRSVSMKAEKLEYFRKMNLKVFKIYTSYSALNQFQLFLSTAASTMAITNIILMIFGAFTQNMPTDFINYFVFQTLTLVGSLSSNLLRIFTICYYNDKTFNGGTAIKYIIQEIRRSSSDEDLMKVSKIFIEQLHERKQFQICGVFAFDMTLPMTFVGYAITYVVVLVQYLRLEV